MKLKKLIVSASAIAAGSGILATVLTSCSKADIDDDLKIELNDEGKFADLDGADFKAAITNALSHSSTWVTFKQALADEIVYKWYENRASKDKNDTTKNTSFRSNLDEWKYQIDEDYDDNIDNLKSKYGANYKFYLQNETLAPYGGTEEAYKHAKLVEKVKSKFIDDAFGTIFFGICTEEAEATPKAYPHIFNSANLNIGERELNNPVNWSKLGFYAKVDGSFNPGDKIESADVNYLAEKPQGDYATLQDYVFNRWFDTEKPFFSAAALFKYSAPNSTKEKKLTDIYNGSLVTVPEAPNEAFPFFGGLDDAETYKGTLAFYKWYEALNNGVFQTGGMYFDEQDEEQYNGTITIGSQYTEDSQTLLLCSGRNMIGGSDGGLYIPYGISAASLYLQMFGKEQAVKNTITQGFLQKNAYGGTSPTIPTYLDDARILSNFLYTDESESKPTTVTSYINLADLYGGPTTGPYHCPIFKQNDDYTFLYGDATKPGVKYVTNNVQVDLNPAGKTESMQPWILELNEAGVHAQTIDGYLYVLGAESRGETKQEALKNVIKYRLMQKKCGYNEKVISADLIDGSNKLKTYFTNNFADIILEMAISENKETNIFRNIEDYKETSIKNLFLEAVANEQHLSGIYAQLKTYLENTITFDKLKKAYDAIVTANDKIYAYRKTQIENSKNSSQSHKKIFENGLTAPLPIEFNVSSKSEFNSTHNYEAVNSIVWFSLSTATKPTLLNLEDRLTTIRGLPLFGLIESVKIDDSTMGFSPQIKIAKDAESNRYWYLSPVFDKMMYGYMGGKDVANYIKSSTYDKYVTKIFGTEDKRKEFINVIQKGIDSTYIGAKMLSGDKNFATYTSSPTNVNFFNTMKNCYDDWLYQRGTEDGLYCDDLVNYYLYCTTVAYLFKDNFANLYTALNNKIAHDEAAFVGYVNKYDTTNSKYADLAPNPLVDKNSDAINPNIENNFYKWDANVDNIYDQAGYAGDEKKPNTPIEDCRISYDQYWHVVTPKDNYSSNYAGFTGIQTKKTNQIDSGSGLQKAAFDQLAKATVDSKSFADLTTKCSQNDGSFFAWAGYASDAEGTPYTFEEVKNPDDETQVIGPDKFDPDETGPGISRARKLARKIADSSTVQDIKDIAKSLGDAFYGDSLFKQIGYGQVKGNVNELKWKMLNELIDFDQTKGVYTYAHCFDRLVKVELHGEKSEGGKYCFESGSNGYKLMLTQINKSDIIEKTIFPVQDETTGEWLMKPNAGITLDEFWYIFCSIATESSVQQLAIADAVKDQYGPDKLKVYDAQLYNQFDSVWIKDWVKKPIGG